MSLLCITMLLITCFASTGSSYTVLNSGELLIHNVLEKDSLRTFQCQTRHRLTGEMVMSVSAGKIVVTGKTYLSIPVIKLLDMLRI